MPHPQRSVEEHRREFVLAALAAREPFSALCARFAYSRRVGYAWVKRFRAEGEAGLRDRSSRPREAGPGPAQERWREAILALRKKHRWGPKKLRHVLRVQHPRAHLPSERTIARLLQAHDCLAAREVRSPAGPELARTPLRMARRCNEVWTIDFKGYFHTRDGRRCDPLTVRDLRSRYLLLIEHVPQQSEAGARAALTRCFRRYGLPRVLRVDNGSPFGNRGPRGLSRLSVWWERLGITVEFMRPASPQENAGHEQMHGVLKMETAHPPALTLRAQAARFRKFRRYYNEERPHEGLGQRTPASVYERSGRAFHVPAPLRYARGYSTRRVMVGGRICWQGRVRVIGRAFQLEQIGLKTQGRGRQAAESAAVVEVYLGRLLLGELHARDRGGIRAARWRKAARPTGGGTG